MNDVVRLGKQNARVGLEPLQGLQLRPRCCLDQVQIKRRNDTELLESMLRLEVGCSAADRRPHLDYELTRHAWNGRVDNATRAGLGSLAFGSKRERGRERRRVRKSGENQERDQSDDERPLPE
jgi:hypothetical protein